MTSSKPYLLRAIYEWLADNDLTPYIMVDATQPKVAVPQRFVEDGKIILNVAMQAVRHLELKNEAVLFQASFSGVIEEIYIPIEAITAIYAYENGRGMVFGDEDEGGGDMGGPSLPPADDNGPDDNGGDDDGGSPPPGKPGLRIVK